MASPRDDDRSPGSSPTLSRLSRRHLLQAAGAAAGLTVAWSSTVARGAQQGGTATPAAGISSPAAGATAAATPVAVRPGPPTNLDAYLRIDPAGTVTLLTGKVEYGQGIQTGFAQLAAEELSLPFEAIQVVMGRTDIAPFDIGTFGSLSTRLTGPRIRQAGTAMRNWLLELGAQQLGQDASALSLSSGKVVVTADASQAVAFADLAAGKASMRELDTKAALKDPSTFTVVGQSIPRPDISQKINGAMQYGIDAVVDGMVWGAVVRPPSFGATLTSIDFSAAQAAPGVVGTFRDGDFAGIAAERYEQVEAAIGLVKATWQEAQHRHDVGKHSRGPAEDSRRWKQSW